MKSILSTLLLTLVLGATAQDLPIENPGFETWDYYNTWTLEPLAWVTGNSQLTDHVYPDSSAFEGELAMKVYPYTFFELVPGIAYQGVPTTFIPATFSFAVKCNIEELDSVFVKLRFTNNFNPVYTKVWSSDESIEEWQMVTLELDQIEPVMDLVTIEVVAGYGNMFLEGSLTTWISVDMMGFDQTNGIEEQACTPLVFPNPTEGSLNIKLCESNSIASRATLYSSIGQIVIDEQNQNMLDLSKLPSGIYTLQVTDAGGNTSRQQVINL
jgi:hypothetical protein